MKYFVAFIIAFLIVYLFYLFTVILQKKKYDKFKKSNQVMYFVKKYKLNVNKIDMRKFTNILGLTNSLIIALAFSATFLVENIFLQLLVGLLVLIPLILLFYSLIGNLFKKTSRSDFKKQTKTINLFRVFITNIK